MSIRSCIIKKSKFFESSVSEFDMKKHRDIEKLSICASFYLIKSAMRIDSAWF